MINRFTIIIEHKQKSRHMPIVSYIIVAVCGRLELKRMFLIYCVVIFIVVNVVSVKNTFQR